MADLDAEDFGRVVFVEFVVEVFVVEEGGGVFNAGVALEEQCGETLEGGEGCVCDQKVAGDVGFEVGRQDGEVATAAGAEGRVEVRVGYPQTAQELVVVAVVFEGGELEEQSLERAQSCHGHAEDALGHLVVAFAGGLGGVVDKPLLETLEVVVDE